MQKIEMNKIFFLMGVPLFVLLIFLSYRLIPFAFDDAYIHFRISENLAQYGRPYFNLEEQVMVTSSPVWTCVLAILSKIWKLPLIVALFNSVLTIIGSIAWLRCLAILYKKVSRWMALLFMLGYVGIMIPSCVGLMETPLAMLFMAISVLLLLQGRAIGWLCVALAVFTRLELIVIVPFFAIAVFCDKRITVYRHIIFFAGTMMILAVMTWVFYGTLIPQPVVAKQIVYADSRADVFDLIFYNILPRLKYPILGFRLGWTIQSSLISILAWAWMPSVFLWAGVMLGRLPWKSMLRDRSQIWMISVGAGGISIALAYIFKHVFLHDWYMPLFAVPILFLFFAIAISSTGIFYRIPIFVFLMVPLSMLLQYSLGSHWTQLLPTRASGARVQRYIEAGSILYQLFPDAKLMTSEIGGLGYSFKGCILDGVGIASPDAVKHHPLTIGTQRLHARTGAIPAAYVNEKKPELIVSYPLFAQDFESSPYVDLYHKFSVPAFSAKCREQIKASSIWGCNVLNIYIRKDFAGPVKYGAITNQLGAALN